MAMNNCPKCSAPVSQSDTHCMDCGADLLAARNDIIKQAMQSAPTVAKPASPAAAVANAAAAGIVLPGENAEEKRLRVFDKQAAEEYRKQRPASIVVVIICAVAACVAAALAAGFLKQAGGLPGLKGLNYAGFKALGFNLTSDPRVMFLLAGGLALAGLLCFVGEVLRLWAICSAIAAVGRGEVPNVVGIAVFTLVGLVLASFLLPPLGVIMGVMFKLSKDHDTSALGSLMVYAGLAALAVLVVNTIWGLAGDKLKPAAAPVRTSSLGLSLSRFV